MGSRRPMLPLKRLQNVEEILADFKGRRTGLIKTFTTDFDNFFKQCDPEKDNLCLYGFPDETWEVNEPFEGVPPEAPEPFLGINFARNTMQLDEWLSLVAVHSDVWLLALSFCFCARVGFIKPERDRLFNMIIDLPSLFEVVTAAGTNAQLKGKSSISNRRGTNSRSKSKSKSKSRARTSKLEPIDEGDEGDEGESICGACGGEYVEDEFWICCDICEKWYHGE